ncbi:MAG: VWA domain-containing protein, partial [Chloroflexi bacterium]
MTGQFDYYSILGIDKRATRDDVQEAFDTLCLNFPKKQQNPETNPEFQRILSAYEVLVDESRRQTYDSLLVETSPLSLKIEVTASRDQINQSDAQQVLYLLVEASPPQYITEKQQPLNLCLVIDRSTSMQGERLRSVKAAVNLIVEKLSSEDNISIISFSDRADVVVPGGPVTNKNIINGRVRNIAASGGTEIYQGLNAGFQELKKVKLEDYTNHLILLTDGHTYGDAAECLDLANRASLAGVGFSAFGIGTEWNDQFLDQLVAPSGGQSGFIESPKKVIDFLRDRIKGLGQIYAQNMRLKNEFPRSISINKGFKLLPFAQPLSFDTPEIRLGDIEGRYPISFLLEITFAPQPFDTRINIPILLTADIPGQRPQDRTFKHTQELFVLT